MNPAESPPIWTSLGWPILRIVLMLIVGLAIYIRVFENKMVFYPTRTVAGLPDIPFESLTFAATDGTRLSGWYIPFAASSHVFLISHGNAGNIGDRAAMGDFVQREFRTNVLMYDYRGYGHSDGKPSEAGLYSDIDGAFAYLRSRGFESQSIYLIGQSLGSAVAVDLASRQNVGGIILEAPFPSVRTLARRITFSLPFDLVMRSRFDSLSKITRIQAPIAVVHGREDPVIPYDLGLKLFEAIRGSKKFYSVDGAVHEGALMSLDFNALLDLRRFLLQNRAAG